MQKNYGTSICILLGIKCILWEISEKFPPTTRIDIKSIFATSTGGYEASHMKDQHLSTKEYMYSVQIFLLDLEDPMSCFTGVPLVV